ncbi:ACT domain-containing protein [Saccharopolyspora gloriosae]|uniref:ACT domain-containing protein n=1 Tax=Saccharopolyspora gloriosae TaxID=455344 RepID=UPI001FB5A47D|nr:ACT domain-containing protein [Saccharopolyspora gloriosae]
MTALELRLHPEQLAVAKVPATADLTIGGGPIRAELVTAEERTIVLGHDQATELGEQAAVEGPFRALEVRGPLDFSLTGVLAALLTPLAQAGISVFTLSTFDTDWILVPAGSAAQARTALINSGHTVTTEEFA